MANWFYYDNNGVKQGPISDAQLKQFVQNGTIVPTTDMETESGHRGKAGQLPGLFPQTASSPFQQQPAPAAAQKFCTNCGAPVSENAYACTSCGAAPFAHRKFCKNCGTALNPEQIVCIHCGEGIQVQKSNNRSSFFANSGHSSTNGQAASGGCSKSRITAALLAILLGGVGVHKFYMGSWGWGIVFVAAVLLTGFIAAIFTGIVSLVEGILYLTMSDEQFAAKYPDEMIAPFRW